MIDNTPVWVEVNCTGESGEKYFGRFQVKRFLTFREKSDVARLFETYARGIVEDIGQKSILYALSQLNFHVTETDAAWWKEKGLDLVDEEPIVALMAEIRKLQGVNKKDETKKPEEKTA